MAHLPGKFTWFEHNSPDPAKARGFYEGLFGWKVQGMPMGAGTYDIVHNGDEGIGGLWKADGGPSYWAAYVSVADVDATWQAALAAGAKPVAPPHDIGDVGRSATFTDPTGCPVSLFRGSGDRDDVKNPPPGDWCWNELSTADPAAALAFYEKVFGYTHEDMDLGPGGTYHVLHGPDGVPRGGIMKLADPSGPAGWMPYVEVGDADASAARTPSLGGQVMVPPQDIPGIGRFAILCDPLGAAVGIIRSIPHD